MANKFWLLEELDRIIQYIDVKDSQEAERRLESAFGTVDIGDDTMSAAEGYLKARESMEMTDSDCESFLIGIGIGILIGRQTLTCSRCESATVEPGREICDTCRYG